MIVLDTHALIWVLDGSRRLGRRAARLAERALRADTLWTSAIVFWEVRMLVDRGRLKLAMEPAEFRLRVLRFGVLEVAVTGDVALEAAGLSVSLADPADCFIAATSRCQHARLMTADARLLKSRVVEVLDARR